MSLHEYLTDIDSGDDKEGGDSSYSSGNVGHDDQVTVTDTPGAMSRIGSSVKGVFTGIICFFVSFIVLYCGATRTEMGAVFTNAKEIGQADEGKLAYVTGVPQASEIGDENYVQPGKYLRIQKNKEYYAVISHSHSESEKKGDKTVTKSYYTYTLEWTSNPQPIQGRDKSRWRDFAYSHNLDTAVSNPTASDSGSKVINSDSVKVNDVSITMSDVTFKGGGQKLDPIAVVGSLESPSVGDERYMYTVYPSDVQYTFAGAKSGRSITGYSVDNSSVLYATAGSFQQLVGGLKSEDRMMWWVYLIIGFVLMSAGLNMIVGPLTTLLDFIPVIGQFGAGLIRFVLTLVAAVISIVFYMAIYYWWVVLIAIAVIVGFIIYKKKSAQPQAA